jgi:hypothetical protein
MCPYERPAADSITIAIGTALQEAERALILATLAHCRGSRKRTAAMLGISLKTLYNRLLSYREAPRDLVDEASMESCAASDPPAWSPTRAGPPRRKGE